MLIQIILLIAALIVSWLVFTLLINIVQTTVKTAIMIAAIVLLLQLGFGIGPQVLLDRIIMLPQTVWTFIQEQLGNYQSN